MAARRTLVLLLALAAVSALASPGGAGKAQASNLGCDTRWVGPSGSSSHDGLWSDSRNWTAGTPTATSIACIDGDGSYTVTLTGTHDVQELRVGLSSGTGTQRLRLEGSCGGGDAVLNLDEGAIASHGAVELSSPEHCARDAILDARTNLIANAGTINVLPGGGGARVLRAHLVNDGTVAVGASLDFDVGGTHFVNRGTVMLSVADLVVKHGATLTNDAGGSITGQGSSRLIVRGATFVHGAGTFGLVNPVRLVDAELTITGTTPARYEVLWAATLAGQVASGQEIDVVGSCLGAAHLRAPDVTNAGTIELTSRDCAADAIVDARSGTLTNAATGWILSSAGVGGDRLLLGDLTSSGRVTAATNLGYCCTGAYWHNQGALELDPGVELRLSGSQTFANEAGGSINGQGFLRATGGTFRHEGGIFRGAPIRLDGADLAIASGATNAAEFLVLETTQLTGDVYPNQSLVLAGCVEPAQLLSTGFTNGGTIELSTGAECPTDSIVDVGAGTLTNNGTLTVTSGGGGRYLRGDLTNAAGGRVALHQDLAFDGAGAEWLNQAALTIPAGAWPTLTLGPGRTFTNGAGGQVVEQGSGQLRVSGGTFVHGAGTFTLGPPIQLKHTDLTISGTTAATYHWRGSGRLSGDVASGQTIRVVGDCDDPALLESWGGGLFNYGTIELSSSSCSAAATLDVNNIGGQLTNRGTLRAQIGAGGTRTIDGSLANGLGSTAGRVEIMAGATLAVDDYTQTSQSTLSTSVDSLTSFGALSASGSASLAGTIAVNRLAGFNPTTGQLHIVTAASVTGTWTSISSAVIAGSSYYFLPIGTWNGASLQVRQASISLVPSSGPAGSTATMSGAGFPPSSKVTLRFTTLASQVTVTTDAFGGFGRSFTVAGTAARAGYKLTATSLFTGVTAARTFTVT